MIKLPKFNIYFFEIILILVIGLIPLLWYKPGYIAAGHDMSYSLDPVDNFKDRLFTWSDRIGSFGSNQTDSINGVFIDGLEAIFVELNFPLVNAQQINFILWFLLPGITMYILLRSLHPAKEDFLIRIPGTVMYMLNHYLLQGWIIAERTKFSIVADLPVIILVIINVFIRKKSILKQSIILSLVLFLFNGGAGIPLWGGFAVVAICCLITTLIYSKEKLIYKLLKLFKFSFLCLFFLTLLNIYWIYPYFISASYNFTQRLATAGGAEGAASWSSDISSNASIINILRLQGIPDWYNNIEHPYSGNFLESPFLILLSLIFPITVFLALKGRKGESKDEIFYKTIFLFILIVGIILTAGSHPPTGFIYDFLLKELPGFAIFRTPFYKFGMVIWLAYAYLGALGFKNLVLFLQENRFVKEKIKWNFVRNHFHLIGLSLFLIFLSIYNYPVFTGSFFNWSKNYSTMIKIPDYIYEAKHELDNNKFSTRTLIMPQLDSNTLVESYSWKYFSLSTIASMMSRKSVLINDAILTGFFEKDLIYGIYDQLQLTGQSSIASFLGADRAIFRSDFDYRNNSGFSVNQANLAIQKSPTLVPYKQIGEWQFLKIATDSVKPRFSSPQQVAVIDENITNISKIFSIPNQRVEDSLLLPGNLTSSITGDQLQASRYITQAKCRNCNSLIEDFKTDLIIPKILPGTRLYSLSKLYEQYKKEKLVTPEEKVDFSLTYMAKRLGGMWVLIKERQDAKSVKDIIIEWEGELPDLKNSLSLVGSPELKKRYSLKSYYQLRDIFVKTHELESFIDDQSTKDALDEFDIKLVNFMAELNLNPIDHSAVGESANFSASIPDDNEYFISLNSTLNYIAKEKSLDIKMGDKSIKLNSLGNGWYQSDPLKLNKGNIQLNLPFEDSNYFDLAPEKKFDLSVDTAKTGCRDVTVNNIDPNSQYAISSNYQVVSGEVPYMSVIEKTSENPEGVLRRDIKEGKIGANGDGNMHNVYSVYIPNRLTSSVVVRFCIDSGNKGPSLTQFSNFKVITASPHETIFISSKANDLKLPIPKIEFVALNQTKYLVKISEAPDKFLLDFNSRFDGAWSAREVDFEKASTYFKGETKDYLDGKVTEYADLDQHLITDVIFPQKKTDLITSHIQIDGFANGWFIEKSPSTSYILLLEYKTQNSLYLTAMISLVSFIVLVITFLIAKKYVKS